jgi:ATPase subunit of ABC transporter with duplicated ATPase domains
MLILQDVSYTHPDKDLLFGNLHLTVNNHDKIALIGNNGTGKSTLLKIIVGEVQLSGGQLIVDARPYFVPQIFGQFNHLTIAQALKIEDKMKALKEILNGSVSEEHFTLLNDDWTIEERCSKALEYWGLTDLDLSQKTGTLSGGQKTKVFLAGIAIHQPELILLDEPSNHLDISGRKLLYGFIQSTQSTLIVVSHDRQLLNLLGTVCELSQYGIKLYGGNYDFYATQKQIEQNVLHQDLQDKEKALRKAREKERETSERQQKLDARGKRKQEKAGVARIMMNTLRNSAENSTSKLKNAHAEKIEGISQKLQELRSALPDTDKMKLGFEHASLHKGKILFTAEDINVSYGPQPLWAESLNFQITSGERIALKGFNGSGKTTLIKLILGCIAPHTGAVHKAEVRAVYVDQDYSLIHNQLTVYEQAQKFNSAALQEHEVKIRLSRFLFNKEDWDKPCGILSGGEKMRLMLCCLIIGNQSPDIIILDEPTNNLDIQNIEILTSAVNEYRGTLIVVSHDEYFLQQTGIERVIQL